MSVRNHRIAAATILGVGVLGLIGWGRSMVVESAEIQAVRDQFRGSWVASSVDLGDSRRVEGAEAGFCSAEFDGKAVAFLGLAGDVDAIGTFYIDDDHPRWIDFKLDTGWIIGLYQIEKDSLTLVLNPLAPPERLGVPTFGRPRDFSPGKGRGVYVFRRAKAGP